MIKIGFGDEPGMVELPTHRKELGRGHDLGVATLTRQACDDGDAALRDLQLGKMAPCIHSSRRDGGGM